MWVSIYIYIPVKVKSEYPVLKGELVPELIRVNHYTGIVNNCDVEKLGILTNSTITIDELLNILEEKNINDLNYNNIKRTINIHEIDLEFRKRVLELIPLKLLYSGRTIPEYGYERSKKFIEEFNKEIPNLNLSTDRIEEIINYNYQKLIRNKNESKKQKILSKFFSKKI